METNVTPVEDNPAPKSTGSLIQISSIYIDLKIPEEKKDETEGCQHNFSIRGYAAEMRKKNPKACMPFASSDGNLKDAEEELPPMDVPKSRWWKCPECQKKIKDNSAAVEVTVHCCCCCSSNASSSGTSGTQKVPTVETNENNSDGTGDAGATGANTGAVEPANDKSVDARVEEPTTQVGNVIATDDSSSGSLKRVEVSVPAAVNPIEVAPAQVEESGAASSESDQRKKHDNFSGASRRKRKVRYLTDLLGDKGNLRNDQPRQDDSSVHKLVLPSGSGTVVSQGQAQSADAGKGSKSPQKADSERTLTDIAISTSERQANASSGNKSDCSKRRTERIPAPARRKNKQIQVHDRSSPRLGEQSSSKANVKEADQRAGTANSLFRSLGTSAAAGRTDNHSKNSQSPQVPEREQNNVSQTSAQVSNFQPSDGKVGLDLSLNSFSENNDSLASKEKPSSSKDVTEKNENPLGESSTLPASEPGPQKNSQLLDLNQNSVALEKKFLQKEMCLKEKTSEVQVCPEEIDKQSDQMASNRTARGSSDDIPMEIVELMAKNQYERGLADTGSQPFHHRMNNNMGRFPEVQRRAPMTQFAKGIPALTSFSTANARSGIAIGDANVGVAKGNSINYSHMNRSPLEVGQPEINKLSIYNMFPQNQQVFSHKMQYPASASVNVGPQRSERVETLSSSKALSISFGLGMQPNSPAQNPEPQHRGKTISDIRADELKRTQEARLILSKPGSSDLNIKPKGQVDYANESITAMQLLSLMDGRSSGNTFNIGSSKPFAPCSYHPRYSTTEKRDFLNGSLFQRQNRLVASVGETSGKSSGRSQFSFSGQPQEQDQSYLVRYTSCIPYTGQTTYQGKDKQKATVGAPDLATYPPRYSGRRSLNQNGLSTVQVAPPKRITPDQEKYCLTNLNPAEYFLPDDKENDVTISGEKLIILKRRYPRQNMLDGAKRRRTPNLEGGE